VFRGGCGNDEEIKDSLGFHEDMPTV